jgi:HK97 family phage major capsid protein
MDSISRRNFTVSSASQFLRTISTIEGTEKEISPHGGKALPLDMAVALAFKSRDLGTDTFAGGGSLIGQTVKKDVTPALEANTICGKLGAEIESGLSDPTNFPVATTDFTATWLAERASVASQDIALAWASMSPHRISVSIVASTLLSTQSAPDFDATILRLATRKLFQALDQAALTGTGGIQPIGVLNTQGVPTFTFGGAATNLTVLSAPQAVKNANAPFDGGFGWALSPDVEARWRNIQKFSGSSTTLMSDTGYVAGYLSQVSTELNAANAGNKVIFGAFQNLKIGVFGNSAWTNVNPYTLSKTGEKIFTLHLYCDCGITRPTCFIISTDSGAQ